MIIQVADRLGGVEEYYFSTKLKEIASLNQGGRDIINLGVGSPDLPPSGEVIAKLNQQAQNTLSHGYQSYVGLPELRREIASWLTSSYSVKMNPESEILPLIGSKEGIMHISMAFLNPGDKVLIPNPGYPAYHAVTQLVQAEAINYELNEQNGWQIDFKKLLKLPLDDVKLMWVNYPNMPTGVKGSRKQFERLVAIAQEHRFMVVNDNPYSQLFNGDPLSIFQVECAEEVCLELNSLSKSHNMAGWRLGWMIGAPDYIRAVLNVKSNMDSGMFMPIQKAAIKALQLPKKWYIDLNKVYRRRRVLAFEIMETLHCTVDKNQEGLFVWAKAPDHVPDVSLWINRIIEKAEVFITPGFIFGTQGNRYLRISLCASEELLSRSLDRITGSFEQLMS
ncbi:MAG: aminotransferase class I/II-fold pyridoxal phosphate-dependent enzyme [Bacteroidota bacterium]